MQHPTSKRSASRSSFSNRGSDIGQSHRMPSGAGESSFPLGDVSENEGVPPLVRRQLPDEFLVTPTHASEYRPIERAEVVDLQSSRKCFHEPRHQRPEFWTVARTRLFNERREHEITNPGPRRGALWALFVIPARLFPGPQPYTLTPECGDFSLKRGLLALQLRDRDTILIREGRLPKQSQRLLRDLRFLRHCVREMPPDPPN